MDRLEDMIRASLEARSGDVEPTPALWDRVERRVARRRWLTVGAWSLGTAVAAVVAIVVVPGLLAQPVQPDIADTPPTGAVPTDGPSAPSTGATEAPTSAPTPVPTDGATFAPGLRGGVPGWDRDGDAVPDVYVAVEGAQRVVVRGTADDALLGELHPQVGPEGEGAFTGLAVRPGAVDELVVAVGYQGEGERDVLLWRWDGRTLEERVVWIGGDTAPEGSGPARLTLAWSEDGSHLTWLTGEGDLRVASFEEMLAVPAELGAFGDVGQTLAVELPGAEVRDFVWTDADGRTGLVFVAGPTSSGTIVLERSGDTFSVGSIDARDGGPRHGTVDAHLSPGAAVGPEYALSAVDGVLELRWSGDGDRGGEVALGGDLADADDAWLGAFGRGVLVGTSDGVWLAVASMDATEPAHGGGGRRLPPEVTYAAFVPFPVE